ncbi:MAG: hypothetical protein VYD54_03370, partial [Bdellovibrionota bacterium]|nr:hypothetical protein [Bdellovibrionota bacterium]
LHSFCSYHDYKLLCHDMKGSPNSFFAEILLENGKVLSFCCQVDQSKKHLKKAFFHGDLTSVDSVFYDVFLELALGKSFEEIHKIQFREVENYLRDLNHRPSIVEDLVDTPSFECLKEGLIEQMLTTIYKVSENDKGSIICGADFEGLALAKKLGVLENFIYHRVSPYLSEWGITFELVYFEKGTLVGALKGAFYPDPLILRSFASFLQNVLRKSVGLKKLNVFLE